jgi:hypothetical protein
MEFWLQSGGRGRLGVVIEQHELGSWMGWMVPRSKGVSKARSVGYDMGGMDDDDQAYSRLTVGMGWDGMCVVLAL